MKNFIETLLSIITNSPSSVLFIIIGIIFVASMIINIQNKKRIGKLVSILGWLFIIFFIILRYNEYLNKLFDNLINTIFMQIFFPNLATYIIIIIITNIIFLYTILNKKTKALSKISNILFFTIIIVLMLYTLEQIISDNINIYQFQEVYSDKNISVLIQSTTLIFTLWMTLIISKIIIDKLIQKSIETITTEQPQNNTNIENITTNQPQNNTSIGNESLQSNNSNNNDSQPIKNENTFNNENKDNSNNNSDDDIEILDV